MSATLTDTTPRIYVACLASYVDGTLHGEWIDCDQDEDEIQDEIQEMLKSSPAEDAEEYAIHDYENFGDWKIDEYESIEKVAQIGNAITEHGEAITHYVSAGYDSENFTEDYQGKYDSETDFVEERLEEQGIIKAVEAAGLNPSYIDEDAIARDWFIDSYWSSRCDGGIYVFVRS